MGNLEFNVFSTGRRGIHDPNQTTPSWGRDPPVGERSLLPILFGPARCDRELSERGVRPDMAGAFFRDAAAAESRSDWESHGLYGHALRWFK